MRKPLAAVAASLLLYGAWATTAQPASGEEKKLVFAVPGIPPVFGSTIAFVAAGEGFFRKYGVDVEVKPFDTGAAAARAVASGDIDFALSPSALIINQISNSSVNLVAIYGLPYPDWLLAATDPDKAECKDLAGQPVGVDTPGGARSLALREFLAACGVNISAVQQVALSSGVGAAMIAGRLAYGVLHLDDVPVIEMQTGRKLAIVSTMQKIDPKSHYLLGVVRTDRLAQNRDSFVRLLAALIGAADYMQDPNHADRVAELAAPTGRTKDEAKAALARYLELGFWATKDAGLERGKLESVTAVQEKVGGIRPGAKPVTYERLVDTSVWRDAAALVARQK